MQRARQARPAAVLAAALLLALPAAGASAGGDAATAAALTRVNVSGYEFRFALSRRSAPKGKVRFRFVNRGWVVHDFKINGRKTPVIGHGGVATITVTFRRAGRYRFVCTVPGHAAAGMKGTFTIR